MNDNEKIIKFLRSKSRLIVFGASTNKTKAGYYVPKYLQSIGFTIIPVNPNLSKFLGETVYDNIDDVDLDYVDGIIIYRKQDEAEKIAIQAINNNIPLIWLPKKITSKTAKTLAEQSGITFIQNDCPLNYRSYIHSAL